MEILSLVAKHLQSIRIGSWNGWDETAEKKYFSIKTGTLAENIATVARDK
jgi:hypothetical protein